MTRGVLRRLAQVGAGRPRAVLAGTGAAVALALFAIVFHLELRTSNLDLIAPDEPPVARFRAVAERFGTPNVLVVVLEGGEAADLRHGVDHVAPRIEALPSVAGVLARRPIDQATLEVMAIDPYFMSDDGAMAFVFVQPLDTASRVATLEPMVRGVRTILSEMNIDGVKAGITGIPVYAVDDKEIIQRDISRLSLLSLGLVLMLFVASFGSLRRPLLVGGALVVAVVLTLGAAAIFPGHLTLLSAFFASILFGLGIDAGIHIVDRVETLVVEGLSERQAVVAAISDLAPALRTSGFTSASVLLAMQLSGFRGFAELGTIAGMGILISLVVMVLVLPALLVIGAPQSQIRPKRSSMLARALEGAQRPWLAWLLMLVALLAAAWPRPPFESNYLDLQPRGSEAVRLENEMVRRSEYSPHFAIFVRDSLAEVADLSWQLADAEAVARVRSIRDFTPYGFRVDDLPLTARRALVDDDGRFAVYAYPREDVWDPPAQARFAEAVQAIDPEVTGMPILGRFMVERSRRALTVTMTFGVALLAVWLLADFRRPLPALLAALPALLTVGSLHASLRLLDVGWNPLNVMALPVVLGVAVDDGVHLVHRFLAEGGNLSRTLATTGRALILTTGTTLAAFGSLIFTSHQGLASFAFALTLGVAAALVLSVLVLPHLLVASQPWVIGSERLEPAQATLQDSNSR